MNLESSGLPVTHTVRKPQERHLKYVHHIGIYMYVTKLNWSFWNYCLPDCREFTDKTMSCSIVYNLQLYLAEESRNNKVGRECFYNQPIILMCKFHHTKSQGWVTLLFLVFCGCLNRDISVFILLMFSY